MKINFTKTAVLLLSVLLFSVLFCGKGKQEIEEEKREIKQKEIEQRKEELDTLNEKAITELIQKYNAVAGWDTLGKYTYVLQEIFIDNGNVISFEGEIKDITKIDSIFLLRVYRKSFSFGKNYGFFPRIEKNSIAEISVSQQQFSSLRSIFKLNNSNEGCFIFKVSRIISVSPEVGSNSDSQIGSEESYSYLEYDFDENLLIFKGKLIDFYLNKIIEESQ